MMKRKSFPMLAAAAIALSIAAGGCAKEQAPASPEPQRKADAGKERKSVAKTGVKLFSGTIETLDTGRGTLTLKGPKGVMKFKTDASAKKDLAGLEIGDKVIVKHTGGMAHSVVKPGGQHPHGDEKEKGELRKEQEPAPKP
jgi:hypothetical protein